MQTDMFVGLTEIKCVCPALKISYDYIVCLRVMTAQKCWENIFSLTTMY